ncbi:MAG TPA: hypothetical protein PLV45_16040 [bacterium]|nr:hypothetical protein [bacterium]
MRQTKGWTLHVAAGLALLVFLGIHMTVMHLDRVTGGMGSANVHEKPIAWENVVDRGRMVTTGVFYVFFLGIALFHGFFGTRTILLETDFGARNRKIITTVLVIAGVGLFIFGGAAAIKFISMSQAELMMTGG